MFVCSNIYDTSIFEDWPSILNIHVPPRVFTGAGPPCCTWVIILVAPPATAIAYENPSRGLEPSVYGGGGSDSSTLFADDLPLVSSGNAALTSASAVDGPTGVSRCVMCAKTGGVRGSGSVTRTFDASGGGGGK